MYIGYLSKDVKVSLFTVQTMFVQIFWAHIIDKNNLLIKYQSNIKIVDSNNIDNSRSFQKESKKLSLILQRNHFRHNVYRSSFILMFNN